MKAANEEADLLDGVSLDGYIAATLVKEDAVPVVERLKRKPGSRSPSVAPDSHRRS
jgi:hypothetical protein